MSFCVNKETPECIEYNKNYNDCLNAGGTTQNECVQLATERYTRQKDDFKDQIYPWKNYDWDYTRFIDNNYNADATGATDEGTFEALFKNTGAMMKIAKGYISDPNPSNNSKAAQTDLTICSKVPEIDRRSCYVMNRIRQSYNSQQKPDFSSKNGFNSKNLQGNNSSSFYYKWGTCPTKDNKESCLKKGHQWLDGKCYRPRYHYIKNKPGINLTNIDDNIFTQLANVFGGIPKGNLPSVVGDVAGIFPTQLGAVWRFEKQGDYEPEPCVEHFDNNIGDSYFRIVTAILGLILCISLLVWIYITITKKKY